MTPAPPSLHRAVCAHDCPDTCGMLVAVQEGRIVSIAGDPEHPITRGFLCGKVNRYAERVYHPGRIGTPLRRVGAKGEGRFAPIGWDQALDEIAEKWRAIIAQHGAEAILPYSYGGTIGRVGFYIGHRFFHELGASRLERTICTGAAKEGLRMTMGTGLATDLEQVAQARLIVVWGCNAVASHVHLMPFIKEARQAGARVVVVDTYRNATARQADWFIPIRPATDTALALGMMRVLIEEGLYDQEFVERYTVGFSELRGAAAPYTPAKVAALTGVPAEDVVALARAYGGEPRAFIRLGLGISRSSNGAMAVRAISCLPALTGAWDHPGGGLLCFGWASICQSQNFLERHTPEHPPARSLNMVRIGEALLEASHPPVQSLYVYNSNPAAIAPHQGRVHQGLLRDDLFLVVHEQFATDTTDFADIVLPATTFLEHDDVLSSYGHNYAQLSRATIAPVGEAKSNLETFRLLAGRMGLQDPVWRMDFEAIGAKLLEETELETPGPATQAALAGGRPVKLATPPHPWRDGLDTPSGKFEFHSARAAAAGLPPLPTFVPSPEDHGAGLPNAKPGRPDFPLRLVTPPSQHFLNSSFGESASSRRLERRPRLKLNPGDAAARGLADGASCRAFNERGECFLTVEVTDAAPPGTVVAESIWWPKLLPGRKGINQLISAELSDAGKGGRFHDCAVEVEGA